MNNHDALKQQVEAPRHRRSQWRSVTIPSEHGGWSLALEPALLGLIVAWSWSGLSLMLVGLVAFLARTPLKVLLVDRWRHRSLDRDRVATRVLSAEVVILVSLAALASVMAPIRFWIPLAMALPLIALELWYDMRSRSRRQIPELAGAIGIAAIAAAIVLAGDESWSLAASLWAVMAARSASSIPFVRVQLSRAKKQPHRLWNSDLAQLGAVAALTVGWLAASVPLSGLVAVTALAAVQFVKSRRRPQAAMIIGLQQLAAGLVIVVATAAGVLAT